MQKNEEMHLNTKMVMEYEQVARPIRNRRGSKCLHAFTINRHELIYSLWMSHKRLRSPECP